ncbi:MAG TPA: 6-bladed beta-propeller [Thermoanaerobaculia bacterium]|nr:6-bladed beta-propeller [Thermoanaerobaculia bacterium]
MSALVAAVAWMVLGGPRIVLDRVVATQRDVGGKTRLFRRISGTHEEFLFQRPHGVAWDGADLIVTDPAAHRVVRLGASGLSVSREGAVEDPVGVAVCRAGIVVTDARLGAVAVLDGELRRTRWLAEGLERPTGVACSGDEIFVVETAAHRVLVFDAAGTRKRSIGARGDGAGEFNYPTAIAIEGHSIVVGDTLNFRIQRIDAETGSAIDSFGRLGDAAGEMPRIKGIAVDSGQRVWISDAHLDAVAIYSIDGRFLGEFGHSGSAPGELSFPAGVAVSADGRIAVADSFNRRVQLFRLVAPGGGAP